MTAVERPPNGVLPIGRKVSEESIDKHLDWLINGSSDKNDTVFSNEDKMDYDQRQNEKNFSDDNGRTWNSPDDSSDPVDRSPSRAGEDDSFDEYEYTDDQRQALLELDNMKLDLGYTIDEDPPEYDVTERVRQLNEELANDPTPIDDDRERSIKFKDKLVDFMAPPPDYSDDESPERDDDESEVGDDVDGQSPPVQNGHMSPDHQPTNANPSPSLQHIESDQTVAQDLKSNDADKRQNGIADEQDYDYNYDIDKGHPRSSDDERVSPVSPRESGDGQAQLKQVREKPLPDYDYEEPVADDEEAEPNMNQNANQSHSDNDESAVKADGNRAFLTDNDKTGSTSSLNSKNDEKVLVERDGTFELVSAAELKAQGMYPFPMAADEDEVDYVNSDRTDQSKNSDKSSQNTEVPSELSPRPPRHPRPVTAATRRAPQNSRRVRSAQPQVQPPEEYDEFNYTSPYALSPEEKEELRRKRRHEEKQRKQEEEKQKKEEEERRRMNNETFEAWLSQKRRDASHRRRDDVDLRREQKQEEEKAKQGSSRSSSAQESTSTFGSQDRESQGAFDEWIKMKRKQTKEEKKVECAKQQEIDEGWYVRPRTECNKAFKEWLKKKNAEKKSTNKDDRQKQRVSRLMLRRTRKAMALARALRQSQSFRYVDYYGYRY